MPVRRPVALIACLAVIVAVLAVVVRSGASAGSDGQPDTAAVADSSPVSAEATSAAPAIAAPGVTVTPAAVSATRSMPASRQRVAQIQGMTAAHRASFPALSGTQTGTGSPLKNVLQDQGVSVPLPDGRSIWIFADTTQVSTAPYFFVTSSAAVSKRGSVQLSYAANGKHLPVEFLPRTSSERKNSVAGNYIAIWPTGATVLPSGTILISYAKYHVITNPATFTFLGAGLYSFTYRGVSDFKDGAHATRIAENLWSAAEGAIGSPVYADGFVYLTRCEHIQCYALRSPAASVTSHASYRWWTGTGWSASRSARAPMVYGDSRPGGNPSITYLPEYGVYATLGTVVGTVSGIGMLWVAPHPWGPWSAPASFRLPKCPAAGCYTLNLHASESIGGRIRISYATSGIGPYVRVTDLTVKVTPSSVRAS